jgi:hypothetical protein
MIPYLGESLESSTRLNGASPSEYQTMCFWTQILLMGQLFVFAEVAYLLLPLVFAVVMIVVGLLDLAFLLLAPLFGLIAVAISACCRPRPRAYGPNAGGNEGNSQFVVVPIGGKPKEN